MKYIIIKVKRSILLLRMLNKILTNRLVPSLMRVSFMKCEPLCKNFNDISLTTSTDMTHCIHRLKN